MQGHTRTDLNLRPIAAVRELLTGLAILVILALTTALVAPYVIDWNGQRAFIEARLSQVLGQKVTIGGTIDVKLLPTPYLVLGQTVIGGDEGPVRLSIHHLDLELSVTPLLHGEFDVTQARLVEPTIRVALAPDRTLPALPDAPAFNANVTLDHIAVTGGTLAIADPLSGRTFALDNLDFEADAASLAGPFKLAGTEGPDARPTSFRLATQAARDGRAHVRLIVAGNADHAALDLDGTVALSSAGRANVRQSFDGRVTVSGKLDDSAGAPVAWTLSGPLKADPGKATLDGGELRLGSEDKNLALAASGTADLGASPHLDLDLSAKTLDLDRLAETPTSGTPTSSTPTDGSPPSPPQLPSLATLRRALAAATPPLPATVDVDVETATWAGETLADLSAHIDVGAAGPQPFKLAGGGPGGSHLSIDGTLAPDRFAGHVALAADDAPRTARWLAEVAPPLAPGAAVPPTRAAALAADVIVADDTIDATNLALTLGPSRLTGSARLDLAEGTRPAKLTAALASSSLAIDALPDIADMRASHALDLDLRLDAQVLKVTQAGDGALAAGRLKLAMTKTGRHLELASLSVDNLGGATIAASGTLDPDTAHLTLHVDAAKLDAAAKLVRQVAAGDYADALVARAPSLAPAKLGLDAEWRATAKGALAPSRGHLDGTLGATTLDATLAPEDVGAVALNVTLTAPEGTTLLRQLGVSALPLDALGPSKISLAAHGKTGDALDTTLNAALGATTLDINGRFRLLAEPRGGTGSVALKSPDVGPLLQSLALAFPDMTARIPVEIAGSLASGGAGIGLTDLKGHVAGAAVTGTLRLAPDAGVGPAVTGALDLDRLSFATLFGLALGPEQPAAPQSAWSNLAFGTGLVDPPRAQLRLTAATLDLSPGISATKASVDLAVAPSLVTLKGLTADTGGGKLGGDIALRRDGRQAGLEGHLSADGVRVDLPGLTATANGKLDLAGSGTTALGLVSSLAGSGEATLAGLAIPQADSAVLPKLFAQVESDDLTVDADTLSRAYADAAPRPLEAGTRSFDLALAGGVLAAAPKPANPADAMPVASTIDATLDLRTPTLTTRAVETLNALPSGWIGIKPSLVVTWAGPPRAPQRAIDVSAFIDAVAARALARETARIEGYEADVRERAFFNARLQFERRRAQDKAKAEDDARARKEAAARAAKAEKARAAQEQDSAQDRTAAEKGQAKPEARPDARPEAAPTPSARPDGPAADAPRFAPARPGTVGDPAAAGRY